MKAFWKPFFSGLAIGLSLVVVDAYAKQQGVTILPDQTIVVNRANQAVPVYAPEPLEIRTTERAPLHIRNDKPLRVEWAKPTEAKWEYRFFADSGDLVEAAKAGNVQEALNKLGDQGWELVAPYTFKRSKN